MATAKKQPKKADEGFAVIATGGKQYLVSVGQTITIEKMKGEFKKGDSVTFGDVLLSDNGKDTKIGLPAIDGAKVIGEIESIGRNQKVTVIKYKQKSRYFKKNGHRQPHFKVKITSIA
jgi:large subunit ribosomal protein L21